MSEPFLQVVRGDPTPEEIAALVAVLTARARAAAAARAADRPRPVSAWRDPSRLVRRPLPHGPGAWRASALPR
ncbi:MAG: acyl-CoA carboxylase subunit epsilon [Streptosporangiales bacterium]|nr:acyl-CoA carboxylase subunit epsilon [Streptosporangiales bacterium]